MGGTSLEVQWLRLHACGVGCTCLIPGWAVKTPTCCMAQPKKICNSQKQKKKKKKKITCEMMEKEDPEHFYTLWDLICVQGLFHSLILNRHVYPWLIHVHV